MADGQVEAGRGVQHQITWDSTPTPFFRCILMKSKRLAREVCQWFWMSVCWLTCDVHQLNSEAVFASISSALSDFVAAMKLNVSILDESDCIEIDQWVWWTFQDETGYDGMTQFLSLKRKFSLSSQNFSNSWVVVSQVLAGICGFLALKRLSHRWQGLANVTDHVDGVWAAL